MAKPSWLIINPESGSGNGSISNSAGAHTGRVARTGVVTVTGVGVSTPATYNVTQTPKAEFVSFDEGAEMSAPKTGGTVTVTGKTNSSKLYFRWNGDVSDVEIPSTYQANGSSTNNNEAISGDPGATSEFTFSISFTFPENTTIEEVNRTLVLEANGGQSVQIVIKQSAGDAYITVDPNEITINANGTAVSVNVNSNTQWTVS